MSPLEWELIGGQDLYETGTLPAISPEAVDWFLREKDPEKGRKDPKKRTRAEISTREQAIERVQTMLTLGDGSLARVHGILCGLRVLDRSQSGSAAAVYQINFYSPLLSLFLIHRYQLPRFAPHIIPTPRHATHPNSSPSYTIHPTSSPPDTTPALYPRSQRQGHEG
jgi:hypothetical protein